MKLDLPSVILLRPPVVAPTNKWRTSLATEYSVLLQRNIGTRRRSPMNCNPYFGLCATTRSPLGWRRTSFSPFANCLHDSTPRWRHFGDIGHRVSFVFARLDPNAHVI